MAKLRSALIVGATGLVGSHLVKLLCDNPNYISVTALVRNELPFEHRKLTVKQVNFDCLSEAEVQFVDDVFCCLGTTKKKAGTREQFEKVDVEYPLRIAALAKNASVSHFIVISAMGASEKSFAYYNRVKGKLEQQLEALHFPRLSIVRPSLLIGKRDELRIGEKFGQVVMKVVNPLLMGPFKQYRSIKAEQVAVAMLAIALQPKASGMSIYFSHELAEMKLPSNSVEEKDNIFDWRKLSGDDIKPLDEEVVFKRKTDVLDEAVTFKKRKAVEEVEDEEAIFSKKRSEQ